MQVQRFEVPREAFGVEERRAVVGLFEARSVGNVIVTASTPSAPGLTETASLTVRQLADSIDVTPPSATIDDGATRTFGAVAFDANDNAIVGASAVVTGDVPANAVVAGAPARVIRMRETPKTLAWRGRAAP